MSESRIAPRPEVAELEMDQHGGPDHRELGRLGLAPCDVLDFSASTNAFGPPPEVLRAIATCDVGRYPDRDGEPLRAALAAREGVPVTQLLLGNGAAQLIWSVAMAYLRPGDDSLVCGPTFGEYRVAGELMGARVVEVRAQADAGFRPDLDLITDAIVQRQPRLAWLCNPNNPTGTYLDEETVAGLVVAHPSTLWIIDEAYRPFTDGPWSSLPLLGQDNVLLLRSLTKDCTLPGLRIGYALASETIIDALRRASPPWSASAPAIAGGLAALAVRSDLSVSIATLRREAGFLAAGLRAQGWTVLPSATHFFLVATGSAAELRACLLREHRIQVRDCTSFGLPQFIRIASRTHPENECLLRAMEAML